VFRRLAAISLAALCGLSACRKEPHVSAVAPEKLILATSGREVVTEADFLAEAKARGVTSDPAQRAALLEEMTERLRLLAYAREKGLENDPEVRRSHEDLLIAKAREALGAAAEPPLKTPSEEELQAAYNARREEFKIPARVRVAMIHTKDRTQAEAALAEAANLPPGTAHFGAVAVRFSEDQATRYSGGDFGDLVEGKNQGALPDEALAACFALKNAGEISPVTASSDGFRIFKLMDRSPELIPPFAQVRSRLLSDLSRKQRHDVDAAARQRIAALPGQSFPDKLARLNSQP
jgi:parvulin-like peptidyl-prolyl isomerase